MAAARNTKSADKTAGNGVSTVEFRGEKFSFPTSRAEWPTRAHQAFQRKNNTDGIELLLGPAQWEKLNEVAPTLGDFWQFFIAFTAVANADYERANGAAESDG